VKNQSACDRTPQLTIYGLCRAFLVFRERLQHEVPDALLSPVSAIGRRSVNVRFSPLAEYSRAGKVTWRAEAPPALQIPNPTVVALP
jgi:hypothetical protein